MSTFEHDSDAGREMLRQLNRQEPGVFLRLLDNFTAQPFVRAALHAAYELGYEDGGNSADADFHADSPDAVQRAREILAEADGT